jgi:hypothetical protein
MNTTEKAYNYQAELTEALINLAWMDANREELDRLRAKYAYADTAEYAARCETAAK